MEIRPMNLRNGLKAVCIIARHLDQLTPYIMAFQKDKDRRTRLALIGKCVSELIHNNPDIQESLVAFMSYALDIPPEEAAELDFHYVVETLPEVLAVNKMDRLMKAAIKLDLVDKKQGIKWWFINAR